MFIDITLKITPKMITDAQKNDKKALPGHLGTHFDVMNKEFFLEYVEREGIIFDVNGINNRDISENDIDLDRVESDMFVAFYTGFIEQKAMVEKNISQSILNYLMDLLVNCLRKESRLLVSILLELEEELSILQRTNFVLTEEFLLLKIFAI